MRPYVAFAAALSMLCAAAPAAAQTAAPALQPPLAGLGFLLGDWVGQKGQVAEAGQTADGRSSFSLEAGGQALLRRDHTRLFDAKGAPAGGFDQIMLIYPEGGTLHADYADGSHLIHYVAAAVEPGRSVVFTSAARPDAPTFQLAYRRISPTTVSVSFAMAPPGLATFQPIAAGELVRAN